jgi:hypothetical protein
VSRFRHSYPVAAGSFTNAGTKGTLANICLQGGFGFDIRFATPGNTEANVKSTTLASVKAAKRLTDVNALRGTPMKMPSAMPCA